MGMRATSKNTSVGIKNPNVLSFISSLFLVPLSGASLVPRPTCAFHFSAAVALATRREPGDEAKKGHHNCGVCRKSFTILKYQTVQSRTWGEWSPTGTAWVMPCSCFQKVLQPLSTTTPPSTFTTLSFTDPRRHGTKTIYWGSTLLMTSMA